MITIPRAVIITLTALFSAYHVVLGIVSMGQYASSWPVIVALCLYAAATLLSLVDTRPLALAVWIAAFDLAVAIALPVLVQSQLNGARENGYATWYVAAVGTLLTIVMVRRRAVFAWIGIAFLLLHTVLTAGVMALAAYGVIGSAVWVAAAAIVMRALGGMMRDASRFARAERQVAEWRAEQEAHVVERRRRLDETYGRAAPLLTRIADSGGVLSDAERRECLLLEAGMRDEIRGRALLSDPVRDQVLAARRRGATVMLLDDGGLDDLDAGGRSAVHVRLAAALEHSDADKYIVRTVPSGSATAVTVVGLRTGERAYGSDRAAQGPRDAVRTATAESEGDDDEVALWLEIPRLPGIDSAQ